MCGECKKLKKQKGWCYADRLETETQEMLPVAELSLLPCCQDMLLVVRQCNREQTSGQSLVWICL